MESGENWMEYKVVLYGAGERCRRLCKILKSSNIEIVSIVDSDKKKWGKEIDGYLIRTPDILKNIQDVDVCITVADTDMVEVIRERIYQNYYCESSKEISYLQLILKAYKENEFIKQLILRKGSRISQKKSVLYDCYNGLGLGGVEAWTMNLCETMINNGDDNVYIISDNGKYNVPDLMKEHILYVDINHREPYCSESILNLIEVIMEKLPCKVITCAVDEVMLAAYLVRRYFPDEIQIISVVHNSNESMYDEYEAFRQCSDYYIGVSRDIKDDLVRKGLPLDRVFTMTCPFACEPILHRSYTEDVSMPIHIGYAGRMEYFQKRMDLMLQLIETLEQKKINFVLEFAGDGIARKKMEDYVYYNDLSDKVKFWGKMDRTKLSLFWKKQDVCINLADYEGRSISILEAMGNGAIPVVTATSGVREDIIDDVNGYIIPIGDYHVMVKKIEYLEKHRGRLKEMGKLAHDKIYPKSLMEPHLMFWKKILNLNS